MVRTILHCDLNNFYASVECLYRPELRGKPVTQSGEESFIKSVGNSTTTPRDLVNDEDVKLIVYVLAESVAARLRRYGLKCRTVAVHIRNNDLYSFERQGKLTGASFLARDIARKAMEIFQLHFTWDRPIRSLGVRGRQLSTGSVRAGRGGAGNIGTDGGSVAGAVRPLQHPAMCVAAGCEVDGV